VTPRSAYCRRECVSCWERAAQPGAEAHLVYASHRFVVRRRVNQHLTVIEQLLIDVATDGSRSSDEGGSYG